MVCLWGEEEFATKRMGEKNLQNHHDNQIPKASRDKTELRLKGELLLIKMNNTAACGISGCNALSASIFCRGCHSTPAVAVYELQFGWWPLEKLGKKKKSVNNRTATTVFAGLRKSRYWWKRRNYPHRNLPAQQYSKHTFCTEPSEMKQLRVV